MSAPKINSTVRSSAGLSISSAFDAVGSIAHSVVSTVSTIGTVADVANAHAQGWATRSADRITYANRIAKADDKRQAQTKLAALDVAHATLLASDTVLAAAYDARNGFFD